MEKIPVLVDTDIGTDIDDAICLAYLLRQVRCNLIGITTVSGDSIKRAQLASGICRAAGKDTVPVASGAGRPILGSPREDRVPQAKVLKKWAHKETFSPNRAVELMREKIRSRPGEVTLLAIGPLTNVGLLFALDPEIPSLLDRLIMMNGTFFRGRLETNASHDPIATAVVYQRSPERHLSVGLDATMECKTTERDSRRLLSGGELDMVSDMAEIWYEFRDHIIFHDPLAAAAIFEPDLCSYVRGEVEVELASSTVSGMTHWTGEDEDGPHVIADDADPDRFFDHLNAVLHG